MITVDDIRAAEARIRPHVRRTPTIPLSALKTHQPESAVVLKLECLQVTGSFKARGAMNRVLAGSETERQSGLVTASGGNHGLAIARTAHVLGIPSTIFVPSVVAKDKVEKLEQWGARVEIRGAVFDDAYEAGVAHAANAGGLFVHPFADPLVVAGQGTLGLEILEDIPDLDVIVVAIGGGGLISGLSKAIKSVRPEARIIGVEPEGSPTLHASLEAGHVVTLPAVTTKVPTMACKRTDDRVFELARAFVDDIVLVSDDDMSDAARWLWFEMGVAADLSGAASLAALHSGRVAIKPGAKICALICGAGPDAFS